MIEQEEIDNLVLKILNDTGVVKSRVKLNSAEKSRKWEDKSCEEVIEDAHDALKQACDSAIESPRKLPLLKALIFCHKDYQYLSERKSSREGGASLLGKDIEDEILILKSDKLLNVVGNENGFIILCGSGEDLTEYSKITRVWYGQS